MKGFTESPISVIIVNWNGLHLLKRCLSSVLNTDYPNFEVIFVDNASSDGSVRFVESVFGNDERLKIIRNDENLGLARGNNVGATYAKGKYLVFLGNDTYVDRNWLRELVEVMEDKPTVSAAQCKQLLMDHPKRIDHIGSYMDLLGNSVPVGVNEEDSGQYDYEFELFSAECTSFVIRKRVFDEMGGFDKDFFLYWESDDLCWRMWLSGYRVVFLPKVIVYHKRSATVGKMPKGQMSFYYFKDNLQTYLKNSSLKNQVIYFPLKLTYLLGRCLINLKKHDSVTPVAIVRAIVWNIVHLKRISIKRKRVQKTRKVSNGFLMRKGIVRKPQVPFSY